MIPPLHWHPYDLLAEGVIRFRSWNLPHLVYPSVWRVAFFHLSHVYESSRYRLDRVWDGCDAWKSSRDHRLIVGTLYELPTSQRDRFVQYVDLDPLDLLTTLSVPRSWSHLLSCCVLSQLCWCCESIYEPGPIIQVRNFLDERRNSWCCRGRKVQPERDDAYLLK